MEQSGKLNVTTNAHGGPGAPGDGSAVVPLLIWYPITRESHAALVEKLEAMEG